MTRRPVLLSVEDVEFDSCVNYDLALVTCGYEKRSSFLVRSGLTASRRIAVRHADATHLSFQSNQALLTKDDWSISDEDASLAELQESVTSGGSRVAIDISSMPRRFLGRVVQMLAESTEPVEVTWLYAPAIFDESASAAATIQPLVADPVSDYFSGSIRNPLLPVGLIAGLGLEPYRAVGLVEFLEPARIWALLGESDEARFAQTARETNREILELPTTTLLPYPVDSVATTFSALESLVFATQDSYRLVIAPSGPKAFTLAALLVGCSSGDLRPAVWRVGGHSDATPSDVTEAGVVVAAECEWGHESIEY